MTSKGKPGFDIAASLNAPHFQEQLGNGQLPPDPRIPTRVKVTLDMLVPYADNPRITQNPNYEDIKESIRNRGLDHAPNITRQSPDRPYMVKDGGNTRLAILNELWQETNDPRFYELDCMFHPWTSDLDVLVGHMVENEARGSMLFIERAIAAIKIKAQLEDQDGKKVSINELSKRITKLGWSLEQSNLNQLVYAYDTLFPIIPNTFWNGMGRPGVKAIRKILDNARSFWESVANPEEGNFEEIWQNAFAVLDGDAFDIAEAQNQLEADIALRLNVPFSSVRGEIQAIAQGLQPDGIRPTNLITDTHEASTGTQSAISSTQGASAGNSKTMTPANTKLVAADTQTQQGATNTSLNSASNNEPNIGQQGQTYSPPSHDNIYMHLAQMPVNELMYHCYGLARHLGSAFGFESLVVTAEGVGFTGFNGFHSGYVLLAEDPSAPLSSEATFYYLYLHQLSSWFVDDHANTNYWQVSNQIPISFLGEEIYWSSAQTMLHRRATIYTAWRQGDKLGQYMPLIEELEVAVAIISFQSGLGE
jgi:ParB family protein of integrating conjugative element (PFGI_1 class)